jgi:hypothetical protein
MAGGLSGGEKARRVINLKTKSAKPVLVSNASGARTTRFNVLCSNSLPRGSEDEVGGIRTFNDEQFTMNIVQYTTKNDNVGGIRTLDCGQ